MKIIGIDPGRNGAIALADFNDPIIPILEVWDMPPSVDHLHRLIESLTPVALAVVEKPFTPGFVGTRNAFTMGENYGALKAVLTLAGVRLEIVPPAKWKAALAVEKDKNAAIRRATEFFPDYGHLWSRAKDHDRAEAAMLAHYGRRLG